MHQHIMCTQINSFSRLEQRVEIKRDKVFLYQSPPITNISEVNDNKMSPSNSVYNYEEDHEQQ